ncbi:sulfurtransferase [Acidimangrovimonas sediminis]|uniref:sulfurtransferase n=1 Tax=Acidimangrovimonas sediminis TaxID=2056283 RepID=UPI000C8045C0|nr:rhodanese-like domain-containing protein [Acidimangrovimonas sediminis]
MTFLATPDTIAPDAILVDTRPVADWQRDAIPGAISVNVYDYFIARTDEAGLRDMAGAVAGAWQAAGLDGTREVVFYEEETGMRSPRGLWFHELIGLRGGRILDGGLAAWRAAGRTTAPGAGIEVAVSAERQAPCPEGWAPALTVTTADVLHAAETGLQIFDVRRRGEFEGSYVHDCCDHGGHVPGALFMFYEDMLSGGRYLPGPEILARARDAGLDPARRVALYCHRGARAATALYGLRLAGFTDLAIHVGSWHEWASDPELPYEVGA